MKKNQIVRGHKIINKNTKKKKSIGLYSLNDYKFTGPKQLTIYYELGSPRNLNNFFICFS